MRNRFVAFALLAALTVPLAGRAAEKAGDESYAAVQDRQNEGVDGGSSPARPALRARSGQRPAARRAHLSRQLQAAMLHQPDDVSVLIRWKPGHAGAARRLGKALVREIPLFQLTAARLTAARIEKLARSRLVDRMYFDIDSAGGDGKAGPGAKASPLDKEEKAAGATWGVRAVKAPQVWNELHVTGTGVRVGIVDSGIDPNMYPGRVLAFRDFSSEPISAPGDPLGHGTHVAGTIGGDVLAGHVHFGVAPKCMYVIGRAIDSHNSLNSSQGIAALAFVADPDGNPDTDDGARVVNCSFSNFPREDDELWTACIEKLRARNVFPVFSAANNGAKGEDSVGSPGVLSCSFTIGAVGQDDKRWNDSSYSGPRLGNHPRGYLKPDLMGPGVDILSMTPGGVPRRMNGTSMAAPHVVGVVALMLEANPRLTVKEIGEILEDSALGLADRIKTAEYGAGLVDAYQAVKRARELAEHPSPALTADQALKEGQAAVEANNLPRAVDRLSAAINLSGSDLAAPVPQQAMLALALGYEQQGNYLAASNALRKMLEIAPAGPLASRAHFELGMCYRRTPPRDNGEQVRAQQRAAAELGTFIKAYPQDPRLAEAMTERALALADAGQLEDARAQAQAVVTQWAGHPDYTAEAQELLDRLSGQGEDPLGQ